MKEKKKSPLMEALCSEQSDDGLVKRKGKMDIDKEGALCALCRILENSIRLS